MWLSVTGYLTPSTLSLASVAPGAKAPEPMKALPAQFDADGLEVSQHHAISKDGTIGYVELNETHGDDPRFMAEVWTEIENRMRPAPADSAAQP